MHFLFTLREETTFCHIPLTPTKHRWSLIAMDSIAASVYKVRSYPQIGVRSLPSFITLGHQKAFLPGRGVRGEPYI